MKNIYSFALICITFYFHAQVNAQPKEWAPIGAKWYYAQATVNPNYSSYTKIESVSDTIIGVTPCKKLIQSGPFIPPSTFYMYSDTNKKVYYYNKDSLRFCLLYDFNTLPNDTYELNCYKTGQGNPFVVKVDSVDTLLMNGKNLKVLYTTAGDGLVIEFSGMNIEKIGNTEYLFPTYDNYATGPLRCYEDSEIGLYQRWNTMSCDTSYFTSRDEIKENSSLLFIQPNPFSLSTTITFCSTLSKENDNTLVIYDLLGRPVKQLNILQPILKIYKGNMLPGIYLLKFCYSSVPNVINIDKKGK